ncbi:MAG: hypothetical protein ABIR30_01285 [Chitinophagaceae bacterium]
MDEFITKSKLRFYRKSYKGEPRFKTKPDGDKLTFSLISIQTSKADFNNLSKQIADTIRFLKRNKDKLGHIALTKEIDHAVLDFGIDLRIDRKKVLYQSDIFPNNLLKLAGDIGLDIELSIYPVDMQAILEKRTARAKKTAHNKRFGAMACPGLRSF